MNLPFWRICGGIKVKVECLSSPYASDQAGEVSPGVQGVGDFGEICVYFPGPCSYCIAC